MNLAACGVYGGSLPVWGYALPKVLVSGQLLRSSGEEPSHTRCTRRRCCFVLILALTDGSIFCESCTRNAGRANPALASFVYVDPALTHSFFFLRIFVHDCVFFFLAGSKEGGRDFDQLVRPQQVR